MLAKAIRNGDLRLYEQVLNDYEHVLINRCLYVSTALNFDIVNGDFIEDSCSTFFLEASN